MNNSISQVIHKINITFLLLTALILLSFFLRMYSLSDNPPGFFADEASIGYNAYTILTEGTDEHGVLFPVFFRAFGEYKGPIQIYSTVPSIALFGLTEFATRLPSVIYGVLTIGSLFFLVKELTKHIPQNTVIALFSVFFLTISPWHIHLSRIAFEQNPYLFFTTLGTTFFLKARHKISLLSLSSFFFVLAMYSYFPARIFIPLFVVSLFAIFFTSFHRHRKHILIAALTGIFFLIPVFNSFIEGEGFSRWQQVNIFTEPPTKQSVTGHITQNYLSHFSLDFLFFKGDIDMPGQFVTRHSVRGIGELYLMQLPLILLGLWFLLRKKEVNVFSVLFVWLLLYPTGSMFTLDASAQATRSVIGVIPFQILSALGVVAVITLLFRWHRTMQVIWYGLIICMSLLSLSYFLHLYFTKYPTYASNFYGWQYGAKHIIRTFQMYEHDYDMFILPPEFNAPHIFFSFYAPQGCSKCIIGLPDSHFVKEQNQLFAVTPSYLEKHEYQFKIKDVVLSPGNTVAFLIGEIVE